MCWLWFCCKAFSRRNGPIETVAEGGFPGGLGGRNGTDEFFSLCRCVLFRAFDGSGKFQRLADRVGSGQAVLEMAQVLSRRVRMCLDLKGRVGSVHPDPVLPYPREATRPAKSPGAFA